jgi:carbon-monoxide dehydrogenase medium subunit
VKPAPFDYVAPRSLDEAVAVLAEHGDEAKIIAGGQSLVPMLAMRLVTASVLVDLVDVPRLDQISGAPDGSLQLGSMATHTAVGQHPLVRQSAPLLAAATPYIGHEAIRNRGTIGGSICHADPAAELPMVALVLDAELHVAGPRGERVVPAAAMFEGLWTTALAPDEILTAVRVGPWPRHASVALREVARRHGDFGLAGTGVALAVDDDGVVERCAIGLLGVAATPVRATAAEAAVLGSAVAKVDPVDIGRLAANDLDPPSDLHASSAYRRRVAAHLTAQALADALGTLTRAAA